MDQIALSRASYHAIKLRVSEAHPDLDEQTLADTVEGLTNLHDIVAAIIRAAVTDEALGQGLKSRIAEMRERLTRFEERAAARRHIARDVMLEANIKKITAPDLTISIRAGTPSAVVIDEPSIPPRYWEPQDPRLNRQLLTADLKGGEAVTGATLNNPEPVLSVRTK
jgi:hypothetical protein